MAGRSQVQQPRLKLDVSIAAIAAERALLETRRVCSFSSVLNRMGATEHKLLSLRDDRRGTHVDFVPIKVATKLDAAASPWNYANTVVEIGASHAMLEDAIAQLESASRRIVSVQPIIAGHGAYLQTSPRSTSSIGVYKSEELGYGYSYTQCMMIVSEDR